MALDLQVLTIYRDIKKILRSFAGNVLDVGCGQSAYRFLLDSSRTAYYGIDVKEADEFEYHNSDITIFNGKDIPFADNMFDGVICTEVLEHVWDYQKLIDEIRRVLKPNGTAVVTIPWSARYHYIPHDFFRYTPSSLRTMFEDFNQVTITNRGTDIASIANKVVVLWFRSLFPSRKWKMVFVPFWVVLSPILASTLLIAHLSLMLRWGSENDPLGYTVIAQK
jgi:SAM-dependent methyltransferase